MADYNSQQTIRLKDMHAMLKKNCKMQKLTTAENSKQVQGSEHKVMADCYRSETY